MTTTNASPASHVDRTAPPGWRHLVAGIAAVLLVMTAAPSAAHAEDGAADAGLVATGLPPVPPSSDNYVTTTSAAVRSIEVGAFSPVCVRDAPFVSYAIVPVGFTPVSGTATLVVKTVTGTVVETLEVSNLSGTFIWPGASVDAAGNGTDWPGWMLADDGSWIPDPSDEILRDGLIIDVTVDGVSASTTVSYVPASSACANPPEAVVPTTTTPPTTTVCVPGQNNDGNPADDCALPQTGGGPGNGVIVGAAALLAGLLMLTAARRRRNDGISPQAS